MLTGFGIICGCGAIRAATAGAAAGRLAAAGWLMA
jgi:hypothetical protein